MVLLVSHFLRLFVMSGGKMRMGMGNPGMLGLLKGGYKHFSGLEEAILKNVEACKELSELTRTSLGPNGMNKLVVNHLEKIFITSDASTICTELEVAHPAAKMIVMAAKMQEQEVGDGSNLVVTFGGEMLAQAEELLRTGVHPNDIVRGYKRAVAHVMERMPSLVVRELSADDLRSVDVLGSALRSVVAAKQYGVEDELAPLVARACVGVMPAAPRRPWINVDNVRVAKLIGGTPSDSQVLRGVVALRDTEGTVKRVEGARICVLGTGLEASETETKGLIVIKTAEELKAYNKGEEDRMEATIKAIADSGANVIVVGGPISEIALHFLEKYGLMVVKIISKFELRRLCRATGARAMVRVGAPSEEEMGSAAEVSVQELSGRRVTVFRIGEDEDSGISTIVLRGATSSLLEDMERAIGNCVNAAQGLCKDGRLLAGAGSVELALSLSLQRLAESTRGLEQYAINKFAEALEVVPRTLAENSGQDPTAVIAALYRAHSARGGTEGGGGGAAEGGGADGERDAISGGIASARAAAAELAGGAGEESKLPEGADDGEDVIATSGVNIAAGFGKGTVTLDALESGILDAFETKRQAIELAADAALTVLRIDQIIMSKQAGGPKAAQGGPPPPGMG